jgi:hypothetical protein
MAVTLAYRPLLIAAIPFALGAGIRISSRIIINTGQISKYNFWRAF